MTYYQKCRQYAKRSGGFFNAYRYTAAPLAVWHVIASSELINRYAVVNACGRTRESACKRLWETLVEDYGVEDTG